MSDAFSVFDDDCAAAPAPLPRASAHPHFADLAVWPPMAASSTAPEEGASSSDDALRGFADAHAAVTASGLRKSRSPYAKACAASLLSARDAFASGGWAAPELLKHARAARGLCAATLEESNWDLPCWQEANLLALCFELAAVLPAHVAHAATHSNAAANAAAATTTAIDVSDATDGAAAIGELAIATFNLAVSSGSHPQGAGACPPWVPLARLIVTDCLKARLPLRGSRASARCCSGPRRRWAPHGHLAEAADSAVAEEAEETRRCGPSRQRHPPR